MTSARPGRTCGESAGTRPFSATAPTPVRLRAWCCPSWKRFGDTRLHHPPGWLTGEVHRDDLHEPIILGGQQHRSCAGVVRRGTAGCRICGRLVASAMERLMDRQRLLCLVACIHAAAGSHSEHDHLLHRMYGSIECRGLVLELASSTRVVRRAHTHVHLV